MQISRGVRVLVMGLVAFVAAGCVPRVRLPELPQPGAPLAERERAYAELAPTGRVERVMTKNGGEIARWPQFVVLGNGQTVAHPADFLPAVLPGSPTALHAVSFTGHKLRHSLSIIIASSILSVGLGMGTGALFDRRGANPVVAGVAFGFILTGALSYAWTVLESAWLHRARDAAFLSYPLDLAQRLGVSPATAQRPNEGAAAESSRR